MSRYRDEAERKRLHKIAERLDDDSFLEKGYPTLDPMKRIETLTKQLEALEAANHAQAERVAALEKLRPEVLAFARLMEQRLKANDHKGTVGWKDADVSDLLKSMGLRANALEVAVLHKEQPFDPEQVGKSAADLANYAMMILDVCGILAALAPRGAGEA